MADHILERRFWLPRPRPEVFEFFADPRNLAVMTRASARLTWLAPAPERLAAGSVLDFSIRVAGLPFSWRVMVREFDPPYRFLDAQLWGPFARWEHRHRFVDAPEREGTAGPPGTWIEDRVTYRLPLGPLGNFVHALGAGRRITAAFEYREARARQLLIER
jgi:ligand-binding SRPBCC domain-containing protein